MPRFWCPVCDQGWVVSARVRRDGSPIWICDECEVMWLGVDEPDREPDDTFSTYMEARAIPASWSEIEVLGPRTDVVGNSVARSADTMSAETQAELELQAMQRRCEEATPGPWKAMIEGRDHEAGSSFVQTAGDDIELIGASVADHDFIANARQDLPRLLAELGSRSSRHGAAQLDSEDLAALVVDALLRAALVRADDVGRAIAIVTEEIEVRRISR